MTEDQLASKILQDAEAEAEATLRKAAQASEDLIRQQKEQALRDAEKAAAPILARTKEEAEAARRQVITEAQTHANWSILSEKRRIIEEALDAARKVLIQNLRSDPDSYAKLLSHLAEEGGLALGGGDLKLLVNSHDAHLGLRLDAIAAEIEKKTKVKTSIGLSERRIRSIGGVLVQADKGRRVVDNTFEGIIDRRRRDLEVKASKVLFAD